MKVPGVPYETAPDSLISIDEAAARLAVSVRTVWRLIADCQLPAPVKVGRSARLYNSDINQFLERLREQRREQL